ncbi:MAG: HAMP domain-containing histidine kinase [Clostridiales bacterium]|jgi:signal transduction histidine kinase|nr:HAMP domain-containing histidine kinase [Clostridiales bacterium]
MDFDTVAAVSNELKLLVSSMRGNVDTMNRYFSADKFSEAGVLDSLNGTQMDCDKLIRLFNDVIDLSSEKLDDVMMSYEFANFSLILKCVVENMSESFPRHKVHLLDKVVNPYIVCDVEKITRIFMSLIINAIKHAEGAAEMFIAVSDNKKGLNILFRDNGKGTSDYMTGKMPKSPVNSSDNFNLVDSGLGMVIVWKFVEFHGGTITLTEGDEWNTFDITLPYNHDKSTSPTRNIQRVKTLDQIIQLELA